MGRIYAKHATSHSWGGIMQAAVCINPHNNMVDYLKGRIYAKYKKSRHLAISLQLTMNLITTFPFTAAGNYYYFMTFA